MTIDVIITICVALVVTAFAIWSIVKSFKAADKINNRLEAADIALAKAYVELENKENLIENLKKRLETASEYNSSLKANIEDLKYTLAKTQAKCAELDKNKDNEGTPMFYIQLKWATPDASGWEHLTKDLFYTRRVFRSLREAAKEARRQVKNPFIASARILKTKERILGKKEWRDLV